MGIDASIYSNIQPTQTPDIAGAMQKGMNLSQLAMQNQQAMRSMQQQQAMRQAYAQNTDPNTGQVNKQGVLSSLGKMGMGQLTPELGESFAKQDKASAEAQSAKMDAVGKIVEQTLPKMNYLAGLPEAERAKAYNGVMKQLESQGGVPMDSIPKDSQGNYVYDPGHFRQSYSILQNTSANLAQMKTRSEIQQAPAKLNSELYGSRSPNAELTSQYSKEPATSVARSSQVAMKQMMDNYHNPSPQGDASLILNAFKIKFPNAPDVNSLKELSESQSVPDQWRQHAAKALEGGLDQGTRDNLIRDGVSTFRANVESLRDTQGKYQARARQQNVNDPTITYEPGVERTYADAAKLQDKIGPYVPTTERGGPLAAAGRFGRSILGTGGNQPASASTAPGQSGGFSIAEIKAELARRKGGKGK